MKKSKAILSLRRSLCVPTSIGCGQSLLPAELPAAAAGHSRILWPGPRRSYHGEGNHHRPADAVAGLARAVVSTTTDDHPDERRVGFRSLPLVLRPAAAATRAQRSWMSRPPGPRSPPTPICVSAGFWASVPVTGCGPRPPTTLSWPALNWPTSWSRSSPWWLLKRNGRGIPLGDQSASPAHPQQSDR